MFTFPNPELKEGPATNLLKPFGINTIHEAVLWVWRLPYGRISEPSNFLLVAKEQKGACSSKHAFLAEVACEQQIPLTLNVGIFMMSNKNTPGIGSILLDNGLTRIPEAHCYLKFGEKRYDFTFFNNSFSAQPSLKFLFEEKIKPNQIGNYKTELHKRWMENWALKSNQKLEPNELWAVREKCIRALSSINN